MSDRYVLTNRERREDVAFLHQQHADRGGIVPCAPGTDMLEDLPGHLFMTMCYHALSTQPAPTVLIDADWRRFLDAATPQSIWHDTFDIKHYALDPPVSRQDSKGKVIDFLRLAETRETWTRLLPEPTDPDITVDVLHAISGGMLKSHAFSIVREMLAAGLWTDDALRRYACTPDGRTRKRAARMGLVDLPERADTFTDLKAFSRALHAVLRLGEAPADAFELPISTADQRCEVCDAARMAACPIPHCRSRREQASA